jgi:hypothetical protein
MKLPRSPGDERDQVERLGLAFLFGFGWGATLCANASESLSAITGCTAFLLHVLGTWSRYRRAKRERNKNL